MSKPKTEGRKKSKRGTKYAAPMTVESQLIGKLGPGGYGKLRDDLQRATRRPRRKP